jgi:hypothetical protein
MAIASRIGLGTGPSRDSWGYSVRLDHEDNGIRAEPEILGLRRKQARLRREEEPTKAPC